MSDKKIIVIGAGSWGSAIADLLATKKHNICLIGNHQDIVDEINHKHTNAKFLPEISLASNLKATTNLSAELVDADYVFIVTPSIATAALIKQMAKLKMKNSCSFVLCTKGLHHEKLQFFHEIIEENFPQRNYAILSGPNFAVEVAAHKPTVTTIASKNRIFAAEIIELLQTKYFKAEYSSDLVTTEICSIVKNIIAIGCGIVDGLQLGENTKAALVCQGVREITILAKKLTGIGNLSSAGGFGDIFLTCSTTKSRNNSLGFEIAQGKKPSELLGGKKTYEGAVSAKSICALASKLQAKLPLCETVNYTLQNNLSKKELEERIIAAILS